MNEPSALHRYLEREQALYDTLAVKEPLLAPILDRVPAWLRKTEAAHRTVTDLGVDIPTSFLEPYEIEKATFFAEIDRKSLAEHGPTTALFTAIKYQLRGYNILRELARVAALTPELLNTREEQRVVELSPGGCGTGEIAEHFGNTYRAAEFLEGRGSVYTHIHESLGVDIANFDGRTLPYPFKDGSADILFCHQAIDAYGPPRRYPHIISELRRIARKVVVTFNPYRPNWNRGNIRTWRPLMFQKLPEMFPEARLETGPITRLPVLIWED